MTVTRRSFTSFFKNDPPQKIYVVIQFLSLAFMLIISVSMMYIFFQKFIESAAAIDMTPQAIQLHLEDLYKALFFKIILLFIFGFIATCVVGLIYLHRIQGPLVRVRQVLNQLVEGKFPDGPVQFRRGDFNHELADDLNQLVFYMKKWNFVPKSQNIKMFGTK